jgi:4-amino-4-deoxy-L-arabinose transferase-like glycosyltransferase
VIAVLAIAPNLVWNARNGFVTAQHTAANADVNFDNLFHLDELIEFAAAQAGVIGPLIFLAVLWLIWRALRRTSGLALEDKFLLCFIALPFLFISAIAFISHANANWAAVALPATIVWVSGSLIASVAGRRVLAAAALLNALIGASVIAGPLFLDPALTNRFKGVRSTRAWEETAVELARRAVTRAGEPPFSAVLVDDRATYFELNYYWREQRRAGTPLPPVRMWLLHGEARNSAESIDPMRPEEGGRVLVVHLTPGLLPFVADDFTVFRTVEPLIVPLGGDFARELEISVGEGFAPAPRDAAFEERLRRQRERPRS